MDFIIRVEISVNGITDEDTPGELDKIIREGHVRYPSWVVESNVKRVRNLKCYEVVRELLLNGMPATEVARQIQIMGEMVDVKLESVRHTVEHYKATLPKTQMLARMVPKAYIDVRKKVDASLNCVEALEDLYHRMVKRLNIGMQREEAMNFLMPNMEKQFAVTLEILSRLHDIKKDLVGNQQDILNDMRDASARVDWSRIYTAPNVNAVMSNPDSRARLVRFVEGVANVFGKLPPERQGAILAAAAKKAAEKDEEQIQD